MRIKNKQINADFKVIAGNGAIPNWAHYVEFIDGQVQLFDLPDPSIHVGKFIVIRNGTATLKSRATNRPFRMFDALGNEQSSFLPNTVTVIGSNGSRWDVISSNRARSPNKLEPVVLAKGLINLADPAPPGGRPFSNGFNLASVTGLGTSTQSTRIAVLFSTPLSSVDYFIGGEIVSNNPGTTQWQLDTTLVWTTHSKTVSGFNIAFREFSSQIQNVSFNFQVSGTQ